MTPIRGHWADGMIGKTRLLPCQGRLGGQVLPHLAGTARQAKALMFGSCDCSSSCSVAPRFSHSFSSFVYPSVATANHKEGCKEGTDKAAHTLGQQHATQPCSRGQANLALPHGQGHL